jgi:hypothetical protein
MFCYLKLPINKIEVFSTRFITLDERYSAGILPV